MMTEIKKKEKMKELSLEERLKVYEGFENVLRDFFDSANFCYEHCFSKEEAVIGWRRSTGMVVGPGKEGCCHKEGVEFYSFKDMINYYDRNMTHEFEDGFQKEQKKNLEKNFIQNGTCKYHSDSGCRIKKLRTPICNAWVCGAYTAYLFQEFSISYSGSYISDNSVGVLLSTVLDRKVDLEKVEKITQRIKEATKRIKNHKKGIQYKTKILI